MDENLHKDNLEEFFRKSFEQLGNEPAEDGWDMPSDDNWENIAGGLSGGAATFWTLKNILIAFLLLTSTGLIYYFIHENKQLKQTLLQQAEKIEELETQQEEIFKNTKKLEDIIAQQKVKSYQQPEIAIESHKQNSAQGKIEKSGASQIPNPGSFFKDKAVKENLSQSTSGSKQQEENTETRPVASGAFTEIIEDQESTSAMGFRPDELAYLPTLLTTIPYEFHYPVAELSKPVLPLIFVTTSSQSRGKSMFIGPYFGFGRSYNHLESRGGHSLPLFKSHEKTEWSPEIGVKAGIMLSDHWSIQSGIGFYSLRQNLIQNYRVDYNPNLEMPTGQNHFESTYALNVSSSYGTSELEIDLRRSEADNVAPGEFINLRVRSKQDIRFITIPILAGYHLKKGNFGLSLKSGISANLLNARKFEVTVNSLHPRMQMRRSRVGRRFDEVNSTNVDFSVYPGIQYFLGERINLALEPRFRINLSSVSELKDYKSSGYSFGTDFSLIYRF